MSRWRLGRAGQGHAGPDEPFALLRVRRGPLLVRAMGRLRFRIIAPLCLLPLASPVQADYGLPRETIEQIVALAYDLDPKAKTLANKALRARPEAPVGPFIVASKLYWEQEYAGHNPKRQRRYLEAAEKALEVAEKAAEEDPNDPENAFLLAMSELGLARYRLDNDQSFKAFWLARSALKRLRKLLREHPDFHDAKMPLGVANCYLSQTPVYLKPFALLLGFRGDFDKGVRLLMEAAEKGFIARHESLYYLAVVHWELKDERETARRYLDELAGRFPGNAYFVMLQGVLEMEADNRQEAARHLERAFELPSAARFPYLKAEAALRLGQLAYKDKDFERAKRWADQTAALVEARRLEKLAPWALLLQGASRAHLGEGKAARRFLAQIEPGDDRRPFEHARSVLEMLDAEENAPPPADS